MSESLGGAFEIRKDVLYFQLSDGRRFSLIFDKEHAAVHDISWNRYHIGESGSMNRDAILAIEHSDLPYGPELGKTLYDFMDNAPIPFPGAKNSGAGG